MGNPIVHDLDILRPPSVYVKLGGKKIDIGFIPSGIAVDIMKLQSELTGLTDSPEKLKQVAEGGEEAQRGFEIAAELCAAITRNQYPEMDKEWLMKNTDIVQIKALMDHITQAVFRNLQSVDDPEIKKPEATEANP